MAKKLRTVVIDPEEKDMIVSALIFHRPTFELYSEELAYTAKVKVVLEKLKAI